MAITVEEKYESRPQTAGENAQAELIFVIDGTDDDTQANIAIANYAPATYNGLPQKNIHIERIAPETWEATVTYGLNSITPGETAFNFDTTGGTQHITQSLKTVVAKSPGNRAAPDHMGAIGVTNDAIEGVDITVPVFNFTITKSVPPGEMTAAYVKNLYKLTATVNNAPWSFTTTDGVTLDFLKGECLFLGIGGSKKSQDAWEIALKFSANQNRIGLAIGEITGINKEGWQYLWTRYEQETDEVSNADNTGTEEALVKRPSAVYVEQVYYYADFRLLGV